MRLRDVARVRLVMGAVAGLSVVAACGVPAVPASSPRRPVAYTSSGAVAGDYVDGDLQRFEAIPYAAPPTGALRWQPPQPARAWKDVKDGTRTAPRCPQNANPADANPASTAEDCLYLNVTAPRTASTRRLPVMVWLHGGGFTQGSGGDYDARRLARAGAVVVSVNYRLGVFGFLGHPGLAGSGAFGLLDQQAALRWVRHNAAAFGGDPRNVTLFGESAGAFSTCAQLTSPAATGLFDKAIIQSGSCSMRQMGIDPAGGDTIWPSREAGERIAAAVAERVGCTDAAQTMPCLRRVPTSRLLAAQQKVPAIWAPSYGTDALPREPGRAVAEGRFRRMPLMVGTTAHEARYFVAMYFDGPGQPLDQETYQQFLRTAFGRDAKRISARYPAGAYGSPSLAWAAIATDRGWTCPTLAGNRLLARKTPVYQYEFADGDAPRPAGFPVPRTFPLGAYHGAELSYLFDGPGAAIGTRPSSGQRRLADQMIGYWTNFAATGNPNGQSLPRWKPLTSKSANDVHTLTPNGSDGDVAAQHHCRFWATRS
ncbi:carboxylesterase/lipase family protein [Nonomuraea sp. NPDC049400]|uniref:carboxylesterase/lipase family protein n=1 Tax=Nonomuraea sp. NPDC049400 TaxID=3364352 RepID=UPI00378CCD20